MSTVTIHTEITAFGKAAPTPQPLRDGGLEFTDANDALEFLDEMRERIIRLWDEIPHEAHHSNTYGKPRIILKPEAGTVSVHWRSLE